MEPHSLPLENLVPTDVPAPGERIQAIMTGSGLTRAARPNGPLWPELVKELYRRLENTQSIPKPFDARAVSMHLSWTHARGKIGFRPSRFQKAISEVISREVNAVEPNRAVGSAFVDFLDAVRCNVIIDLNFDDTVETILRQQNRRFIRFVGSEGDWASASCAPDLVVWKVHGSIEAPPSVVLSPTEYQRVYQINELGTQLALLGATLGQIWTIGVGLLDDDVWGYLLSRARDVDIVCLWVTDKKDCELRNWWTLVNDMTHRKVVIRVGYEQANRDYCQVLKTIGYQIREGTASGNGTRKETKKICRFLKRCNEFENRYEEALNNGSQSAVQAIIAEYKHDYLALHGYILAQGASGLGERWLPGIKSVSTVPCAKELADDLAAAINCAATLHEELDGRILAACAAQRAIQIIVDLASLYGLDVHIEHEWPTRLHLAAKQRVLVGANVFASDIKSINPMHWFQSNRAVDVQNLAAATKDELWSWDEMVTEEEWEAAQIHFHARSAPILKIGENEIPLAGVSVPPAYPWGFVFTDIREYRKEFLSGTISRYWHAVKTEGHGGLQILKGGSIIDRDPSLFLVGRRGTIKAGEYAEFSVPATLPVRTAI